MTDPRLNVWIVDDDQSVRWVLEKALKHADMATRSFERAEHLLDALETARLHVRMLQRFLQHPADRLIVVNNPDIEVVISHSMPPVRVGYARRRSSCRGGSRTRSVRHDGWSVPGQRAGRDRYPRAGS